MYEFKYFQASRPAFGATWLKSLIGAPASLTTREMEILARAGWELVGTEDRNVLSRTWLGFVRQRSESFMVFRRRTSTLAPVKVMTRPGQGATRTSESQLGVTPRRVRLLSPAASGMGRSFRVPRPGQPFMAG